MSLAIVAVLSLGITVAWAGSGNIVADDDLYNNDAYEIVAGQQASIDNIGNSTHTVTADEEGPDGKPLFRSGNVSGGQTGPVNGSQFLANGEYGFHCSFHPTEMRATLFVVGVGTPVPRPAIDVKVKAKKLEKVVDSGKLKVRVSADEPTDAEGIELQARKGKKSITKKKSLNLGAGDSEVTKLKLKKKAVEKLADLEKAKVKVSGEVDFGSPAKASKKLK